MGVGDGGFSLVHTRSEQVVNNNCGRFPRGGGEALMPRALVAIEIEGIEGSAWFISETKRRSEIFVGDCYYRKT